MRILGLLIGLLVICIGGFALIAPDRFLLVAQQIATPTGLYFVATLRVAGGIVLLIAAGASRMPKTLRVFGILAILAGITTPLFGAERARAFADWSSTYGPGVIRAIGIFLLALGSFITYAFTGKITGR